MNPKLPYKKVKIKLKDFDNDPKYKRYKGISGVCNEGPDENEIWVNKNITKNLQGLTILHELVHVRRQENEEELDNFDAEEDFTELEALSRCQRKNLTQAENILKNILIYDVVNGKKIRLYPNKPEDLKKIYKKIKQILRYKYAEI